MALESGTRIDIYEVTGKLGEGAMGEVYRAHDTTLGRDVALKVLPDSFTADPDRLGRFQREAKVLASLNHPNIGGIYGLETSGDNQALVLELIEGPTLAERIADGPVPVEQTVAMIRQIAEALSAAHDAGVVHRDLKPANIKVRPDGTIKVLDFGLAKATEGGTTGAESSDSPTMTAMSSQVGAIIGTAAYMSPEQARGELVNKQADIWALGCVCYELLTGRRAFEGRTMSDTLASVLAREADQSQLPDDTPPALVKFMNRCLEKEPTNRLRDAAEGILQLDERLAEPVIDTSQFTTPSGTTVQPWQKPVPILLAILMALVIGAGTVWSMRTAEPAEVVRFSMVPSDTSTLSFGFPVRDIAISPNGSYVVYNGPAVAAGVSQLNLRAINEFEAAPLRGSEGAVGPFFSPDDEWVGFIDLASGRRMSKVSVFGGPPVALTEVPTGVWGASWGLDDQIVFGTRNGPLFMVSGGGGEAIPLTSLGDGETSHSWPSFISEKNAVIFVISSGAVRNTGQLAVLDLSTQEITRLGLAGVSPRYVQTGHLVYAAGDGSVRAVPFDASSLTLSGNPVPLLESILVKANGSTNFDIATNGELVYSHGNGSGGAQVSLVWVNRQGQEEPVTGLEPGNYESIKLSPDNTRFAFDFGRERLWTHDIARGVRNPLTTEAGVSDTNPVWTPDGNRVVFSRGNALFWMSADGTGEVEELLTHENASLVYPESWSPDGKSLLFTAVGGGRGVTHIERLTIEGDRVSEVFIDSDRVEGHPVISPDGQWVAYHSDVSERMEVYVDRFPDGGSRQQISTGGGRAPLWAPDGTELYYRNVDGRQILAVSISSGEVLTAGVQQQLFEGAYLPSVAGVRPWDLTADGERFLMAKLGTTGDIETLPQIQVVLNWFEELTTRVPIP
tara:strand:- start:203 stop:2908 length:2706 start_codon:yes stop_codon:yes gene_type:complete